MQGVATVAGDVERFGASGSHHCVADYQQTMFLALDMPLDDHGRIDFAGGGEGRTHRRRIGEVEEYRFATACFTGFNHHRVADVFRRFNRSIGATHKLAFGHRDATGR